MKAIMSIIIIVSSFRTGAQEPWAGNWEIPMVFQKNFPEKKKPDYWCRFYIKASRDSAGKFSWTSDVHHEKPIWSFTGWASAKGDTLYMYAVDYVDHRPRKEKLVNKENDPSKPFYILVKKENRYILKRLQGKTEEEVEIKKLKSIP
jgi:hypothetical protein